MNVNEIKEAITDIRRSYKSHTCVEINRQEVELILNSSCFLLSSQLSWSHFINSIITKAQQRLYFLSKQRKVKVPSPILLQSYRSVTER